MPYLSRQTDASSTASTPQRDVKVTIYRSYRDLDKFKSFFRDGNEPVNFTLHRKSTRTPTRENSHTLPRGFGRSRSTNFTTEHRATLTLSPSTPNGDAKNNFDTLLRRKRPTSAGSSTHSDERKCK